MASELIAGIGLFKTMFDMAKGLKDINDAAIRNSAVIELQEKILSAREQQSALTARIGELEEKVAGFETWNAEKDKYELKAVGSGGFARMLKPNARGTKPPHWLCPNCFEQHKKSYFQKSAMSTPIYVCQTCKSNFVSHSEPAWSHGTD